MGSYEYNKPYVKSLHRDHRRGLRPLGQKNTKRPRAGSVLHGRESGRAKIRIMLQKIMDIHDLLQQAKELCKPDTTYTVEVIHCGKAMEWLENQKTL